MIINLLKNAYKKVNSSLVHNVNNEKMPIKKQKSFLDEFNEPQDDYERSFFKYKCYVEYCYYSRRWLLSVFNVGAMLLLPVLFFILKYKGKDKIKNESSIDAVIENVPRLRNDDVLPDELRDSCHTIKEIEAIDYQNVYLSHNAINICKVLRNRYFWHFYYRLIVMIKLAQFNHYIQDYNPQRIIFYSCEREFSGPLQTLMCEMDNVEYISFMHGDYLYAICFAFQRYTKYYTWDEAYNQMFRELRCEFQTVIYQPRKLSGIAECLDEHRCKCFATYYFSAETRKNAEEIFSIFQYFENKGLRCKIRPHPRFSDINMLEEVFGGFEIANATSQSLADSITETFYIIGLNTTVLSQAYFSGKQVVIDDISMPNEYNELREKRYIMLNRPHMLLSEVINEISKNNRFDSSYDFYIE